MSIPWSAPEVLLDETAGTVESEVFSLAATVYSFLAGRSPFEIPGDSNKSTDLIARIARARPQPIDRNDVPVSLESALSRAMSRKPENRHASILEFVRELQAVETELGLPQTQVEVAMDDWALATVADLEDKTRIRGAASPPASAPAAGGRRRRRTAAPAGTRESVASVRQSKSSKRSSTRNTSTGQLPPARGMQVLAWTLVACAVLVIGLGATATLILLRSNSGDIPVVSDIAAVHSAGAVSFSWEDPGLNTGDSYQIETNDGAESTQTQSVFVLDATDGQRVCITVSVIREGKLGEPSGQKCVDVG
jgi:serine/threonine protein kinase